MDEQAQMIKDLFPDAKKVGILYCSAEANSQYQVDTITGYLEKLGYTCSNYAFSDSNDLSTVVTNAASESDVIYVPTDNTVASNTGIIHNTCLSVITIWAIPQDRWQPRSLPEKPIFLRCPLNMRLSLQRNTILLSAKNIM